MADTLQTVTAFLRLREIELILDEYCAELLPNSGLRQGNIEDMSQECDLAIVGTGYAGISCLNAAIKYLPKGLPPCQKILII